MSNERDLQIQLNRLTEKVGRLSCCRNKLKSYIVSELPTGNTENLALVTDADTPVSFAEVIGGGSDTVVVYFNGTVWAVA